MKLLVLQVHMKIAYSDMPLQITQKKRLKLLGPLLKWWPMLQATNLKKMISFETLAIDLHALNT